MFNVMLVTGSRAEYGIMRKLIEKINACESINLSIVATAMHMEKKYGYTYKDIENDGFEIDKKIDMNLVDTSDLTILNSMSTLQNELALYMDKNNFDLCIILGDRYEMLSVANCCVINKVPICHLHGGEKTLGNYDEFIRHAITKMSHLHLTSTNEYKNRVIQLGEEVTNVYNVGSLGVENVLSSDLLSKMEVSENLNIILAENYFVVLFHPVTLNGEKDLEMQVKELLAALHRNNNMQFIFIGSNSDSGSDKIASMVNEFIANTPNSYVFKSLSTLMFHSLVSNSKGLIGNSSSGLIEIPSLGRYTLNIGDRQKGRVRGDSVIDVSNSCTEIDLGIKEIIKLDKKNISFSNPYYKEDAANECLKIILSHLNNGICIEKIFNDLEKI